MSSVLADILRANRLTLRFLDNLIYTYLPWTRIPIHSVKFAIISDSYSLFNSLTFLRDLSISWYVITGRTDLRAPNRSAATEAIHHF